MELRIIADDTANIFTSGDNYVIPLYQRAFAWEDKQLLQLIEDVYDSDGTDKYYLGALIVSKSGNSYEVIDGQQRLTALYLMLSCIGVHVDRTLSFARRDRSNYTLDHLAAIMNDDHAVESKSIEETIRIGLSILKNELSKTSYDIDTLKKKLSQVVLYRIEVPSHTDLNRYFEIMNTRGEQLEQHDIIKAQLMGYFGEDEVAEKDLFADIWEACSDMTGYAQMHCDPNLRWYLYTSTWNDLPREQYYKNALASYRDKGRSKAGEPSISEILKDSFKVKASVQDKDDVRVRFESIIDFPYFLIHCLKIYVSTNDISSKDGKELIPELMNDKAILSTFKRVINDGLENGEQIDKRLFAERFIVHLLKMRYLFDRFIIKREYVDEKPEGEWSLKELRVSNAKPYFTNTYFHNYYARYDNKKQDRLALLNKTVQSALRVSFTSPKVMHWITKLLTWLANEDNYGSHIESLHCEAEQIAREYVVEGFFNKCASGNYELGVNTPHIVFNYLDYLLWKNNDRTDFIFEFRNSVEHWYPRNPSNGTFPKWEDGVDRFGNLCLVQSNINAKFSNMDPVSKKNTFHDMICKGSLKLRMMADKTSDAAKWKDDAVATHEQEMIELLKAACNI